MATNLENKTRTFHATSHFIKMHCSTPATGCELHNKRNFCKHWAHKIRFSAFKNYDYSKRYESGQLEGSQGVTKVS